MIPQIELFAEILLTILFGAILGLETETREKEKSGIKAASKKERERIGGVRTYAVISLFGGIAGVFYVMQQQVLVYILFLAIIGLILAAYILNVQIKHAFGLTTEVAIIIAFILGFLTTSKLIPIWLTLVILVMLAFFLSQKRGIGALISKVEHKEIIDVVKFALVAIVVLPILPNQNIKLIDIASLVSMQIDNTELANLTLLNPFNTWLIVVVISGINLFGYFLTRIIGSRRGLILTSAIGGFISSTSAIISFASRSKHKEGKSSSYALAGAGLIANSFSFITIAVLMLVNNRDFFSKGIWSFLIMFVVGVVVGLYFIYKDKSSTKHDLPISYQAFSVLPAIKFVLIIVGISLLIQVLQLVQVNNILVLAITALTGFTGMDPATIAYSSLVKDGVISLQLGVISLILANGINFFAKILYSYVIGSKEFARQMALGLILTAIIGGLGLLFLN